MILLLNADIGPPSYVVGKARKHALPLSLSLLHTQLTHHLTQYYTPPLASPTLLPPSHSPSATRLRCRPCTAHHPTPAHATHLPLTNPAPPSVSPCCPPAAVSRVPARTLSATHSDVQCSQLMAMSGAWSHALILFSSTRCRWFGAARLLQTSTRPPPAPSCPSQAAYNLLSPVDGPVRLIRPPQQYPYARTSLLGRGGYFKARMY